MTTPNTPEANETPGGEIVEKSESDSHIGEIRIHAREAGQANGPGTPQLGGTFSIPWGCLMKGITTHDKKEKVLSSAWTFNTRMGMTYMQTGAAGSFTLYPTNIVTGGEVVTFLAADREPKTVIASASIQKENGAVYDVFFEHRIDTSAPLYESNGGVMKPTLNILKQSNGNMFIQLGNSLTSSAYDPGFAIGFVARVFSDDDTGRMAIMQFVQCDIRYVKDNGEILSISTPPGQWYLDKRADTAALTYGRSAPVPVSPIARGKVEMNDSPYLRLPNNVSKIEFNETFRTYLVYKNNSPDCRWVPLSFIEWGFRGAHEKERATSPWPETFKTPPVLKQSREVPTHTLPEWVGDTAMLVERITKEFPAAAGDMFSPEWIKPARPSRQMLITTTNTKTPQQQADVANAIGGLLSKLQYGDTNMLAWTSPENANEAKKIPGVSKVEELNPQARYIPKRPEKPAESEYIIYVAPFYLYDDDAWSRQFAIATAPLNLDEVGTELLAICSNRGISGVTFTIRGFSLLNLTFPALVTNEDHLRALAAHPQVNYVQRRSEYKG